MGKLLKWGSGGCALSLGVGCVGIIVLIAIIIIAGSVINAIVVIIASAFGATMPSASVPSSIHGMPTTGIITAIFHDTDYYARFGRQHEGVDIANSAGTPIYCTSDVATVVSVGTNPAIGYGYYLKIRDEASGWTLIYGHMLHQATFRTGDSINHGQIIGQMGSTGNSTGNHLHYELRDTDNIPRNPADSAGCCGS